MPLTSTTADIDGALSYLKQETDACWRATLEGAFKSTKFSLETCAPTSPDEYLWLSCELLPAQFGPIGFGVQRAAAVGLGHLLLSAKSRASEHDHHALHATTHLMGQLAASITRCLADRLNTTISAADCSPAPKAPDSPHHFTIPFAAGQTEGYLLTVSPSPNLLSAIAGSSFLGDGSTAVAAGSRMTPRNLELL